MATVTALQPTVQDILMERPYLAWERIPLAAALCTLGYDDGVRAEILDRVRDGSDLADLAPWLVESCDLAALEEAHREGRTAGWMGRYRERGGFLPPICGGSDGAIPAGAVLVPPELELLDELLDALVVFDDDRTEEPAAGPCPCQASPSDPCKCGDDPRIPDAPDMLPPIAGGACDPRDDEPAGPTDAEWDEMHAESRWTGDCFYGYE